MTTLDLQKTNKILSQAGIDFQLTERGFEYLVTIDRFNKAVAHCLTNAQALDDVTAYINHIKSESAMVFHQPAQPRSAPAQTHQQHQVPAREPANRPAPAQQAAPAPSTEQEQEERIYVGHHVYGSKAALYFRLDKTRSEDSFTVAVEGTIATGPKQFDWNNKIILQITRSDLPTVAAVLFGLLPKVELKHYGAGNDKSMTIESQGGKYFVNIMQKDKKPVATPVFAADMYEVRALFLRQLVANTPESGVEGVLTNLKCHAHMLKAPHQG